MPRAGGRFPRTGRDRSSPKRYRNHPCGERFLLSSRSFSSSKSGGGETVMRKAVLTAAALALLTLPLFAQTADEIVGKYIKAVGGMDRIQAVKTLRRTGKFTGGGGFEADLLQENKRP